ncbi:MAG TPA: hypothetical protein VF662_02395 [Allosphingosinicella sp.]|jgi:hypothetical protein
MSDVVKVALIAAATVIAAVAIYIYFSPYQTCVRAQSKLAKETYVDPESVARVHCTKLSS